MSAPPLMSSSTRPAPSRPQARLEQFTSSLHLDELLRMIWRHRTLLVGTVFTLTTLAIIVSYQLTPRYTADASVMVDARRTNVVDLQSVMSGLPLDIGAVQSEAQILTSRSLAEKVVEKAKLRHYTEFNGSLRPPSMTKQMISFVAGLLPEWLEKDSSMLEGPSEEERAKAIHAAVVESFLSRLAVIPVVRSYVISISVTSEDPELAALVTNTVADLYIVDQLEAKFEATRHATTWLNDRLTELRDQVRASERAVAAYREEHGIVVSNDTTILGQQLAELNSQIIIARTERARAEARLSEARDLLGQPDGAASAAVVLDSPLIQKLREQEAEVLLRWSRKIGQLVKVYSTG